ncbi:MAG: sulfurtransferase [Bacillota bacterium]|nr:sulfurtransferase [Bacillota bacterium]
MEFVKEQEWLLENLQNTEIRIVDCRFSLANPNMGKESYLNGHIPGAVFFDLEKDLSKPVEKHGGRHPLPDLQVFIQKLEDAGINEKVKVIVYDGGEGSFASRFWWMLKYLGHENVFVLNGGFSDWNKKSYPTSLEIPSYEKNIFDVNVQHEIVASIDEVKKVVQNTPDKEILIDSREERRYLGLEEPIDKKAGHIPGAINKPWIQGLNQGHFKSEAEQMKRFSDIDPEKTVIVYCGSGVTAAPNYLALKEAGYKHVKLYVGSFSDWISYEENEIG